MLLDRPATRMVLAAGVGFAGLLATATIAANNGSILLAVAGFVLTAAAAVGCFAAPAITVLVFAAGYAGISGLTGSTLLALGGIVYAAAFAAYFGSRLRPLRLRQLAGR